MRMFFTGLTDLFLILFLTSISSSNPPSLLTVDDFSKLRAMHQSLQVDKQQAERGLQEELRIAQKDKEALTTQLAAEKARVQEAGDILQVSNTKLSQINKDLLLKDKMFKEKESLLADLERTIQEREEAWKKDEASYKMAVEANQALTLNLQSEVQRSQQVADQMKELAAQANKKAEEAQAAQQSALLLKEAALKEKQLAEQKAREAREVQSKAEMAKEEAVKAAADATRIKEQAEAEANKLAAALDAMRQDTDKAYQENARPLLQQLSVTYEERIADTTTVYKRELSLLPVEMNGQAVAFFPSQHIGFSRRNDTAPNALKIAYKGNIISQGWINKNDDLIAIVLPDYAGGVSVPLPVDMSVKQQMPVLLAVRNHADRSIGNLFRGLSNDYFAVNRDNITLGERGMLIHFLKGFRGTGKRAERILQGDHLVDLNARFIGIAKDADQIIRIESLQGWEKRTF